MKITFHKYHGTGNDFILIDNRIYHWLPTQHQVAALCHRRFGVGADGLMLLEQQQGYDFGMRYFNSDGNESSMCGNGGRCITAFARACGLIGRTTRFLAVDGEHQAGILDETPTMTQVTLKMSDTILPVRLAQGYVINTGSPHFVVPVDDFSKTDVVTDGRELRYDPRFMPSGINVNFVARQPEGLFVRTYERGVEDETLSCGTGVTAVALVNGFIQDIQSETTEINTRGGSLRITYERVKDRFINIWLEGPAEKVFTGEVITD
jgi:diaminopimelate epimerase